jgi:AraC-like DNA-binding protein
MHSEYLAQRIPARKRSHYWQNIVSNALYPMDVSVRSDLAFDGALKSWDLGTTSLIELQADASRYQRHSHHVQRDNADCVLVSFSAHSDIGFTQDGVDLRCRKNQFFIEKGHRPSDCIHSDVNNIWMLRLPLASVRRHMRSLDPFYLSLYDADSGVGGLLFDMIRSIPARYVARASATFEGIGQTLIELLVLAIETDERALTSSCSSVQRGHLARIERFVRRNLGNPDLSPEMVAQASRISVRYLHALFRGSECSFSQWVRQMRLESCRAQLCEPLRRESLSEIAYRWGFNNQAQFSRHFKSAFGITPREMRADAVRMATKSATKGA